MTDNILNLKTAVEGARGFYISRRDAEDYGAQAAREWFRPARVRLSRRSLGGLTLPRVADDGRMRAFVTFRDAERFVSDDAGTARRAKRRGRGAVTGETEMEIRRVVG